MATTYRSYVCPLPHYPARNETAKASEKSCSGAQEPKTLQIGRVAYNILTVSARETSQTTHVALNASTLLGWSAKIFDLSGRIQRCASCVERAICPVVLGCFPLDRVDVNECQP